MQGYWIRRGLGFSGCVLLMLSLFLNKDLKYELNEVKDGQYGSPPSSSDGEWNGMVGEVMRRVSSLNLIISSKMNHPN